MSEKMMTAVESNWVGFVTGTDWTGFEWTCCSDEQGLGAGRVVVERSVVVGPATVPALVGCDGDAAAGGKE
jgi:hypothetical protein